MDDSGSQLSAYMAGWDVSAIVVCAMSPVCPPFREDNGGQAWLNGGVCRDIKISPPPGEPDGGDLLSHPTRTGLVSPVLVAEASSPPIR